MATGTFWARLSNTLLQGRHSVSVPVLITSLIITIVVTHIVHQQHIRERNDRFIQAATEHFRALEHVLESSDHIGKAMVGLFEASDRVEREEFTIFADLFLEEYRAIQALEWVPYVKHQQRAHFESIARQTFSGFQISERDANGAMLSAGPRAEYFPVYFVEPYTANQKALGYDLSSNEVRKQALEYAIENNRPSITGRIELVQNRDATGFLIYYPIFPSNHPLAAQDNPRNHLLGMVVVVLDIHTLIETALEIISPTGMDIRITDMDADQADQLIYASSPASIPLTGPVFKDTLKVHNREWTIELRGQQGNAHLVSDIEALLVFISGLVTSLLLFFYLRLIHINAQRLSQEKTTLEQMVEQRTQELRDQNRELESYSYSIAHDLRTPLRSIASFSQILVEDTGEKLNPEERSHLDRIVASSKHMATLIDDILQLARIARSPVNRTELNLSQLCAHSAERLTTCLNGKHRIRWDIEEGIIARGDPVLLRLLFDNLIGNAIKFSAGREKPHISFGSFATKTKSIYYIRDNGIGFDMQFADTIFGAFQRLHSQDEYEGTGIGLATVQGIVQRHGGHVWTESTPNGGASFYFTLDDR